MNVISPRIRMDPVKSPDLVDFADLTEDQLALLVDLSRKVNSRLDLQTILRRVVEHSILLAGAERGFLFLSDGTSHLKVKVALDACGNDILDEPVRISSGVVSAMLAHGIPIFLEDVRLNSDFSGRRSLESMGVKYVLGIPLKSRSHILGFIRRQLEGHERLCENRAKLPTIGMYQFVEEGESLMWTHYQQMQHQLWEPPETGFIL